MATDELFTKRLDAPRQDLNDAYSLPANFLEIEVCNPETHGITWRQKYTDYEVKMKVSSFCVVELVRSLRPFQSKMVLYVETDILPF